jgi:hypothetical protein
MERPGAGKPGNWNYWKGADMKNLTPSGYQGFPSLFNGLFGGVALLFRRLVRRQESGSPAGQMQEKESEELKPISSPFNEPDFRPLNQSGDADRH